MGEDDRILSDAYFHGLLVNPEDESSPGYPCLYRVSRSANVSLDDLWLVWMSKCFYRKPRRDVVYQDWDLAFATYWRDVTFNAAESERPCFPNKEILRRAVLRCANALRETRSELSRIKASSEVTFVEYVDPWDAAIPRVQGGHSSDEDSESSSASDDQR
jgi:hypothetical protein